MLTKVKKRVSTEQAASMRESMLRQLAKVDPAQLLTMTESQRQSLPLDGVEVIDDKPVTSQRAIKAKQAKQAKVGSVETFVIVKYNYADHVVVTRRDGHYKGMVFNNMAAAYDRAKKDGGEYWCNIVDYDGKRLGKLYPLTCFLAKEGLGGQATSCKRWQALPDSPADRCSRQASKPASQQAKAIAAKRRATRDANRTDVTIGTHIPVRTINKPVTVPPTMLDYYNRNKRPTQAKPIVMRQTKAV